MQVWDLHDETQGVTVFRETVHGPALAGPIAAVLAAVAVVAALPPGPPLLLRWTLLVGLGGAAAVVAIAGLRRHQTVLSLGLTALALLVPLVAGIALSGAPADPPAVRNAPLPDAAAAGASTTLVRSAAFRALPDADRRAAGAFAGGVVLRLRTLHGDAGPFPERLALSNAGVVEATGALRGTPLGPLPDGMRLTYSVSDDRRAFRVLVGDVAEARAVVRADSALAVPGLD